MTQWTLPDVLDVVAETVPDRAMTVCGARRTTFAEAAHFTRALANFLIARGLGAHRERSELRNWECGQDRVALLMRNDLYPEVFLACLRARAVPVNVNHYYSPTEVADLLSYVRPRAVIYHRSLGARFGEVLAAAGAELLVSVDDGSDAAPLPEAVTLSDALAAPGAGDGVVPSPDDLVMMCTGGTTGRPKGVLWRQGDMYVASMAGADHESSAELAATVSRSRAPWFAVSPLMHAAGLWTALAAIMTGQTVIVYDDRAKLDAHSVWRTVESERPAMMTIVGDAYAAPLVAQLQRRRYDLASLIAIATGGAATNQAHRRALLDALPNLTLVDGYGSSETGSMGLGHSRRGAETDTFALRDGGAVASADLMRLLAPGDPEVGWVARTGRIPLGYFDDPQATERTFPEIDGRRVVISGDRGTIEADGTIRLLGRDSLVVNTGGEKVFVEEVDTVLRAHPAIADAVVVGRPSERWGQEVVALIALHPDTACPSHEELHDFCTASLAQFKAPKDFLTVTEVRRLGNGKADYRWAKQAATQRLHLTAQHDANPDSTRRMT